MASILGENNKWKNATTQDLASINAAIASKTSSLNEASRLYDEGVNALTACYGLSKSQCLAKTGSYVISRWSPQTDTNKALVVQYTKELKDLLALQQIIASTQSTSASTTIAAAAADTAIQQAKAVAIQGESAQTSSTAKKVLLYGGIGIGAIAVIIGTIFIVKKLKRK